MRIGLKYVTNVLLMGAVGYIIGGNFGILWNYSQQTRGQKCLSISERSHVVRGSKSDELIMTSDEFIMIGVMTTRANLDTRATAIFNTWGRDVTGRILFYVGKAGNASDDVTGGVSGNGTAVVPGTEPINIIHSLPVVVLNDVTDTVYPPRRKSFAMLRHMEHNFGRHFRWFVRADDDAYIRYDILSKLLRSLNDSKLWYVGSHGFGEKKQRGHLGLLNKGAYCMGGPGVIFSSLSLRHLVPHLPHCHDTAVTSHEDTELGRCVQRHLGISCSKTLYLFLHFYSNPNVALPFNKILFSATFHPLKKTKTMWNADFRLKGHQAKELRLGEENLKDGIKEMDRLLRGWGDVSAGTAPSPGQSSGQENNHRTATRNSSGLWDREREAAQAKKAQEEREGRAERKGGAETAQAEREEKAETAQAERDEKAETAQTEREEKAETAQAEIEEKAETVQAEREEKAGTLWAHVTVDNWSYDLPGIHTYHDFALNTALGLLSQLQKLSERKATVYQRYSSKDGLQHVVSVFKSKGFQSFRFKSPLREFEWREIPQHETVNADSSPSKKSLSSPQRSFAQRMTPLFTGSSTKQPHKDTSLLLSGRKRNSWPGLHMLVPLRARYQSYVHFVNNLSKAAREYAGDVLLHVALFKDPSSEHTQILKFSKTTSLLNISVVELPGAFSRGVALNALATDQEKDSILVFIDVDMIFTGQFLYRVALNVKPNTAYSPVVFSKFSPETECYGQAQCTPQPFNFSQDSGLWRATGFGMVCIRTEDFFKCGRMNSKIVGWGKEDVDFIDRCKQKGVDIFRAADTGLTHVYHQKTCDPRLASDQRIMCRGSRFSIYGSEAKLSQMMMDIEKKKKTSP